MSFSIVLAKRLTIVTAQMDAHRVRFRLPGPDVGIILTLLSNRCTQRDLQRYGLWAGKFDLIKAWSKHHFEWFAGNKQSQDCGMSWSKWKKLPDSRFIC